MKYEAILFDCDGVLVDSEPLVIAVLRDALAASGWDMPLAECAHLFIGRQVRSQQALVEARTGRPLTDAWMADFYATRNAALAARLLAMPGAHEAVRAAAAATSGRIACASGADRAKIELQLAAVGLRDAFGAAVFSGHEMPATKPAPDVYLAAARHLGVAPARCLVIEDTPTGVQAGKAAGATVWALRPGLRGIDAGGGEAALRAAGADALFGSMTELPALFERDQNPASQL